MTFAIFFFFFCYFYDLDSLFTSWNKIIGHLKKNRKNNCFVCFSTTNLIFFFWKKSRFEAKKSNPIMDLGFFSQKRNQIWRRFFFHVDRSYVIYKWPLFTFVKKLITYSIHLPICNWTNLKLSMYLPTYNTNNNDIILWYMTPRKWFRTK